MGVFIALFVFYGGIFFFFRLLRARNNQLEIKELEREFNISDDSWMDEIEAEWIKEFGDVPKDVWL